ncbi:myo-inositol-1-phosphate synthase [Streptomyces marianii]|uniref:Myo-inositol-1-phosphate synthase n=2 Tax=Streptomyces marianii TaxID=1817406 RepID=A0A5R9EJS8_9ACTN|nr:myo-inositol-1-phosphate synthase [Streptomyces marianii]
MSEREGHLLHRPPRCGVSPHGWRTPVDGERSLPAPVERPGPERHEHDVDAGGTGVWLIGARGSVATTTMVGSLALSAGLVDPTGCVTALPCFHRSALPGYDQLVFGGHDPAQTTVLKRAEHLVAAGVLPGHVVEALEDELVRLDASIAVVPTRRTQGETAEAIAADLAAFRDRHGLSRVVVVHLAPTEGPLEPHPAHADPASLHAALSTGETVLPSSSLYAFAAFTAGCPFVDFTPCTGARLPALEALAARADVPHAGSDGKTGETLVKSVLAPMFAQRHLRVHSWSGLNVLGGGDGANLADGAANGTKAASKRQVLAGALGYQPEGPLCIEYVPDIGDFKTAWDLISFTGFLGTRMRMEFTWHGCDSALAAPLVLDLVRLTAAAHAAGRSGPLRELAFFFKDPVGSDRHGLAEQWRDLLDFASALPTGGTR